MLSERILRETENSDENKKYKATCLEISEGEFYFAGIDISRQDCVLGICDLKGNVIVQKSTSWRDFTTPHAVVFHLSMELKNLISSVSMDDKKFLGIGITLPGPFNAITGRVIRPVGMDFWHEFMIIKEFKKYFSCEIWAENNAVARAIGENYYGLGAVYSSFIELTIYRGIGCGIVSRNQIFRPENGVSVGIGHSSIDFHGERCSCGNIGCLENYALPEKIVESCSDEGIESWGELVECASNSSKCMEAVQQEATYLVSGLIGLINLFSPQAIILSGELNTEHTLLIDIMERLIHTRLNYIGIDVPKVCFSALPAKDRLISACAVAIEQYFWEKG